MKADAGRFALDQYAHYLCDLCDKEIGENGWVAVRLSIVRVALCDGCRRKELDLLGANEPPQDRLYVNGEGVL